ncbi:hypothetical protein [Stackebrandtia soli]|uniref:hypothetical protein n=1 Tax=Stackebrandtia soli TaxID=1892856 RepID=UPI0039EA34E4
MSGMDRRLADRPRPAPNGEGDGEPSLWEKVKWAASETADHMWWQARRRYDPSWPPPWLPGVLVTVGLILIAAIAFPVAELVVVIVSTVVSDLSGMGWTWLGTVEFTDLVTHPVRAYIEGHAPAIGLTPSVVFGLWVGAAIGTWLLSGTVAGRIGWILTGLATVGMVWVETPAAGRWIAIGITTLWWLLLSVFALAGMSLITVVNGPMLFDDGSESHPAWRYFGTFGGPRRRVARDVADAVDAVADTIHRSTSTPDRDNVVSRLRVLRNKLLPAQAYPPATPEVDAVNGQWLGPLSRLAFAADGDVSIGPDALDGLRRAWIDARVMTAVVATNNSVPTAEQDLLGDDMTAMITDQWPRDPEWVVDMLVGIHRGIRRELGSRGPTPEVYLESLDETLGSHFPGRRDLIEQVSDRII